MRLDPPNPKTPVRVLVNGTQQWAGNREAFQQQRFKIRSDLKVFVEAGQYVEIIVGDRVYGSTHTRFWMAFAII